MNRDEFFRLKEQCATREEFRAALVSWLKSPAGQEALQQAPRALVEGNTDFPLQDQAAERIADLLLQEV